MKDRTRGLAPAGEDDWIALPKHALEAHHRPATPPEAGHQFGSPSSAPRYSPAAVAHLRCWPDHQIAMTKQTVVIRDETESDAAVIAEVTVAAFETLEISNHTEQFIIEALRSARALALSLVAEVDGRVVGHIAFSPVTISSCTTNLRCLSTGTVRRARSRSIEDSKRMAHKRAPATLCSADAGARWSERLCGRRSSDRRRAQHAAASQGHTDAASGRCQH